MLHIKNSIEYGCLFPSEHAYDIQQLLMTCDKLYGRLEIVHSNTSIAFVNHRFKYESEVFTHVCYVLNYRQFIYIHMGFFFLSASKCEPSVCAAVRSFTFTQSIGG